MQSTRRLPWWGYLMMFLQLFPMMFLLPIVMANAQTERIIILGVLVGSGFQGTSTIAKSDRPLNVRVLICLGITIAVIAAEFMFFRLWLIPG